MSYKPSRRQTYRQRHMVLTPARHHSFRQEWEANFDGAVAQANKLKEQGYLVDEGLQRGALTESQAKRLSERWKAAGYDVQFVPIAMWSGERVVFVVFKPPPEQPKPEPQPPPQPKSSPQQGEEMLNRFLKLYWGNNKPDMQEYNSKGYLINPARVTAIISPTAPRTDVIVQMLRDHQNQGKPLNVIEVNRQLLSATNKNKVIGKKHVSFDPACTIAVRIECFKEALKVLGKGKVQVYGEKDKPVYFTRDDGYTFAIACATDADSVTSVPISELEAQSKQFSQQP